MNGVIEERKLATVSCVVCGGVFPIGGSINGVDQLAAHADPQNYIEGGAEVEILNELMADVTTYGGFHDGQLMKVVAVHGRRGFYTAGAFA